MSSFNKNKKDFSSLINIRFSYEKCTKIHFLVFHYQYCNKDKTITYIK